MFSIKEKLINFLEKRTTSAQIKNISCDASQQLAFKALAVKIAVSYIANAISKCEIKFFDKGKKTKNSYEYYAWNIKPNDNQSGSQFINKLVTKMLTEPDGALVIQSNGKMFVADEFQRQSYPFNGDVFSGIRIESLCLNKTCAADEVLYFKLEDENITQLIDALYVDYGKAISYALQSFLKVNGQKYKLKIHSDKIGDKTFNQYYEETLKEQLKSFIQGTDGIYPENNGFELTEFKVGNQTKNCDDLVKLRKDMFQIAGQAYKIPMSMMEGNINNMSEVVKAFITFAVEPVAKVIDDVLTGNCFDFAEWQQGSRAVVDTSQIPYSSIVENSSNVGTLIANTILNPNEARGMFGLDAIDEEFMEQFFITKNNSKAEDVMDGVIDSA